MRAIPLPNGKPSFLVRAALAAAVLLASAEPVIAAKKSVVDITTSGELNFYEASGGNYGAPPAALDYLTDGDLTRGVSIGDNGAYFVLDFSGATSTTEPMMYVDEIVVGHAAESRVYSLYVSADKSTWTPVATNVTTSGETSYQVKDRIIAVKYVFVLKTANNTLGEFHVKGFVSSVPKVVSSLALANLYSNTDENLGQGGTGGGSLFSQAFDGKFTDPGNWRPSPILFPNVRVGYYILIDFTSVSDMPNGYFVTEIKVGHSGLFPFSLYYWSPEINDWVVVPDADHIQKKSIDPPLVFGVNATTTKIKYVFEQDTYSDYGNGHMSEIQVWGMDPDDVPCLHPGLDSIEWTTIEGTATCTEQGTAERFCPVCGERFTKQSDDPPLGHDYITTLDRPGAYKRFGSGSISCSRCDFFLPCTNVYEQASTNGPVDLAKWGGLAVENFVQFTDLTVTSSDHPQWGPVPEKIIDGNFGWANNGWCTFWASAGWNDQHVDFTFGTTIDLTWIDICVHNHPDCMLQFYDVDDETGEETLLQECLAEYIEGTHEEGVEAIVFAPIVFTETADQTPFAGKTYYVVDTNGTSAVYVPTNGIPAFEEETTYYEASEDGPVVCVRDGSNWRQTSVAGGFETNATYAVQSATADKYYTQESSGKFVSAGSRTEFDAGTTYYRLTGQIGGVNQATIVDSRPDCTRQTVRFYSTPCKHLRLRMDEETGYALWSGHSMCIVEMRPWGTVLGAGDTPYRKETLMIFR